MLLLGKFGKIFASKKLAQKQSGGKKEQTDYKEEEDSAKTEMIFADDHRIAHFTIIYKIILSSKEVYDGGKHLKRSQQVAATMVCGPMQPNIGTS